MLSKRAVVLFVVMVLVRAMGMPPDLWAQANEQADSDKDADSAPSDTQTLVSEPVLLDMPAPQYPAQAITDGLEADVLLRFVIDEQGAVVDIEVVQSAGEAFDKAAVAAVEQAVFEPAQAQTGPVAVRVDYTVSFRLSQVERQESAPPTARFAGTVADVQGRPLQDVSISLDNGQFEAQTDSQGYFVINDINAGKHTVVLYKDGYRRAIESIVLQPGEVAEVQSTLVPLNDDGYLTVVHGRKPWREVERAPLTTSGTAVTGVYELTRRDMELQTGSMDDVNRAVHRLPGVAADGDMLSTFFVRGGDSSETVFYLDRVRLGTVFRLSGVQSLFNGALLEKATFHAGGQPASLAPSLSGSLQVEYIDGGSELDGMVDVNFATFSTTLSGPFKKGDKTATFVLGARRTYFEAYFALMKAIGFFNADFSAPEYGDLFGRARFQLGERTSLRVTTLFATSSMAFIEPEADETPTIEIAGRLKMASRSSINYIDLLHRAPNGHDLALTMAATYDLSRFCRQDGNLASLDRAPCGQEQAGDVDTTNRRETDVRLSLRGDWNHKPASERYRLEAGFEVGARSSTAVGNYEDIRSRPPWMAVDIADYGYPEIELDQQRWLLDVALYGRAEVGQILGPLRGQVGLRVHRAPVSGLWRPDPRLGLSLALKSATTIKFTWALAHQERESPLLRDSDFGNRALEPERALHYVLGIEQLLPVGALLRMEGYAKQYEQLVVHPDDPALIPASGNCDKSSAQDPSRCAMTNDGFGWAAGVDFFAGLRTKRTNGGLTLSLAWTQRNNPSATRYGQQYAPAWDQRVGLNALVDTFIPAKQPKKAPAKAAPHFTGVHVSAVYSAHSPRPLSTIEGRLNDGFNGYIIAPVVVNNERFDRWFMELNLRVEFRSVIADRVRFSAYIEVLNSFNWQSPFMRTWGWQSFERGERPTELTAGSLNHLPIRPWFGWRLEF